MKRFRDGARVLVQRLNRHESMIEFNPPLLGTVARLRRADRAAWVSLDKRTDETLHPFPADDQADRGTHVLAWPEDCEEIMNDGKSPCIECGERVMFSCPPPDRPICGDCLERRTPLKQEIAKLRDEIARLRDSSIYLRVCERCEARLLAFPSKDVRDGFAMFPPDLCSECEGKMTQMVRILLMGHVAVPAANGKRTR